MADGSERRRRVLNFCAAVAAFLLLFGCSRALGFAARLALGVEGELPAGIEAVVWAISFFCAIAALSAIYRPAPEPERFAYEGEELPPQPSEKKRRPAYLVPVALFVLLAVDIILYFSGFSSEQTVSFASAGDFALRAALGCAVYPILEETFFRGLMLRALCERDDRFVIRAAAVVFHAAAFASVHRSGGFLFAFIAGVALAVPAPLGRADNFKSFIPVGCVIAHALYNLSLFAAAALGAAGICDPATALCATAGAVAIVAGVMILARKR